MWFFTVFAVIFFHLLLVCCIAIDRRSSDARGFYANSCSDAGRKIIDPPNASGRGPETVPLTSVEVHSARPAGFCIPITPSFIGTFICLRRLHREAFRDNRPTCRPTGHAAPSRILRRVIEFLCLASMCRLLSREGCRLKI